MAARTTNIFFCKILKNQFGSNILAEDITRSKIKTT